MKNLELWTWKQHETAWNNSNGKKQTQGKLFLKWFNSSILIILINYISITRKQIHPHSENSKHYTMPVKIVTMGVAMAIHRRISITGSLCGRLENGHLGKFSASNQLLAFDIHEIHEIRWKPRFHDLKKTNESNASPASSPTSPCRTRQAERETRNEREHTLASWFTKNINSWKFMNTCTLRPHKNCHEKNEKQGQNSGKKTTGLQWWILWGSFGPT